MKATGMTRPVDPLGRIVIPKEIRETLDIQTVKTLFFASTTGAASFAAT